MKKKQLSRFLGLCAAGLVSGYASKRIASPPAAPPTQAKVSEEQGATASTQTEEPDAGKTKARMVTKRSDLRSTDTLESIKTAEGPDLYARLALWMVDASEEDISAYWQHYRQQKGRSNEINDLIFINWTRINPQGATAAAKGTPDEHYSWWAWACHDPKGALAAAIATNPDRVNNVTWGIGEFHPTWLREHFDELPENSRMNALSGMSKWDDGSDPLEKLEFLKKHGYGVQPGVFKVLALRDPWTAYDWLQENGNSLTYYGFGSKDTTSTFIDVVGEQHPDVLKRIAEQAPSGELKRKMEAALFANLLKEDPEAAVEQAKEIKAPYIAAQRLSAAGMSFIASDPDKAFELAQALFEACPQALNLHTTVEIGNSSSSSSSSESSEVNQLVDALLAKDPEKLVGMHLPKAGNDRSGLDRFHTLTNKWAEQDLTGLSEWATEQTDPVVREPAMQAVINKLQNDQNYPDAAEWAMSLSSPDSYLHNIVANWSQTDPQGAAHWVETVDLPEERIEPLKKYLRNQQ